MKRIVLSSTFESYRQYDPAVPVVRVSHTGKPAIHRFYDTSPISPSGRYIALTEFPYEDRLPTPRQDAAVYVVCLETGEEVFRSRTEAWDTQTGAHAQWGNDDRALYFNRLRGDGTPYGVRVDIFNGDERPLQAPVYMCSPDGRRALTPNLARIGIVQAGYGVNLPPPAVLRSTAVRSGDGVFVVNTESGGAELLVSFAQIVDECGATLRDTERAHGAFYGFHVKWNPQGSRVMFIMRWLPDGARSRSRNFLITFRPDGSDVKLAVDWKQWRLGHHPNWCADGERIIMNLSPRSLAGRYPAGQVLAERAMRKVFGTVYLHATAPRFYRFRYDGTGFELCCPSHVGSGHPTTTGDGRHILTDAYVNERVAFGDGTVPLRLLNISSDTSRDLVRIRTRPRFAGPKGELRVDPHPAWHASFGLFTFNACPDGTRAVFVADVRDSGLDDLLPASG